ncbi:MAG TPA: beta-galactosidase, partial [Opitutaceae bacterium]
QGRRSLRRFVEEAASVGLKVVVRCGPWCHGEVRNGGIPDWVVAKGWPLRSTDERFLGLVRGLYGQIAQQLRGKLWKDGGPVIGIQLDNEFSGPAEYLLALKAIARGAGLDVPVYTRTGWNQTTTPLPFGEILPLYGAYAEGFWSRELTSMPGNFGYAFRFSLLRFDDNIAQEQMGHKGVHDAPDVARYPYLTCEIGGGMMSSYHRRILIDPRDIEATTLVKLGSGSTLPGYYMYQGGVNPEGRRTTLMEAQDTPTTNYNDLPVRNYDFQAPLGAFGEIRPQYDRLRRLHLFLANFGESFARMQPFLPDDRPGERGDTHTLRWAVRSNGGSGYVFVNNYERSLEMPAKPGVQFCLRLPAGPLVFPAQPVDVPADCAFFWPFNMDLGGVRLSYATAQPLCQEDDGGVRTVFFAETPGVAPRFAIEGEPTARSPKPGPGAAFEVRRPAGGLLRIVVLSYEDSLALWQGEFAGRSRVFITRAGLTLDGGNARLRSGDRSLLTAEIFPAPTLKRASVGTGVFTAFGVPRPAAVDYKATLVPVAAAGPPRNIPLGPISEPEATEPTDADFAAAARWRIVLPPGMDMALDPILRIRYRGDVARITLNGRLLIDDFYNGRPLDLGLRRYMPEIAGGKLELSILPMRRDALSGPAKRIFMADSVAAQFSAEPATAAADSAEIVPVYEARLAGR